MSLKQSRFISGLILLLAVFLATGSWAQTSRGTVSGTITDSTGAVVPNANVQLVQIATNIVRETKTNDELPSPHDLPSLLDGPTIPRSRRVAACPVRPLASLFHRSLKEHRAKNARGTKIRGRLIFSGRH